VIFEDGLQQRDFVHVSDIAQACLLALETKTGIGQVFNVGSGQSRTVLSIAEDLASVVGMSQITPEISGKYRAGDIRHCFADISCSQEKLGFRPRVDFRQGMEELAEWLADQSADDHVGHATAELERRGLVA
jgi:dTDP-L-rhamnose 4-epimerase